MAAQIVSLGRPQDPERAAAGIRPEQTPARSPERPGDQEWCGASGRRYTHKVYSLIECPPLPMGSSYVMVRRDAHGVCTALRVGMSQCEAPTLNLAHVRQQGALAGANEIHLLVVDAISTAECKLMACDLRAGLFGTLAPSADPERGQA
jgi:hypothetical protein